MRVTTPAQGGGDASIVTVGDVVLKGAIRGEESGGWNAPEKTAETGFAYSSFVDREPIEATVEGWIDDEQYQALDQLRNAGEPFPASIDHVTLPTAKLNDMTVEREGRIKSHRWVSIEIAEVRETTLDEVSLVITAEENTYSSASENADPSIAYSQEDPDDPADDSTDDDGRFEDIEEWPGTGGAGPGSP